MGERAPPFPERIGRYDVLLPIASGGMGTVYLARATSIGGFEREVALKLIHSHLKDNASFASDLVEEAKLTVRIGHPNVVSVIDVGEDPFGIYLVMEYVEGDTLGGLQKRATASAEKKLPVRFGLKLLLDALTGLHAAHELRDPAGNPTGLVHRDFSPQNILVGVDGIGRLTDFGIAKAATRVSDTTTGTIKGKIAYMAPEQARGETIDRRTDIWSAGVVAWELITGKRLYAGQENEVSTLLKIATTPPPRLRDVKPDVPPLFDEAVARALTMDPAHRWPTALAFKQGLLNACRMHGETADTDEVATFVSRVVDPVVAARRGRVEEILRLRAEVGKLAARADVSTPALMTPSDEMAAVDPATLVVDPATRVMDPATRVMERDWDKNTRVAAVPVPVPMPVPPSGIEVTRTDTTSVTAPSIAVVPPAHSRWAPLLYAAGGVIAASIIFLAASLVSRRNEPSAAAPPPPAEPVATATTEPTAKVEPSAAQPVVAELRAPVSASVRPVQAPPPAATTRTRVVKPAATSTVSQPVLPRSPYEPRP